MKLLLVHTGKSQIVVRDHDDYKSWKQVIRDLEFDIEKCSIMDEKTIIDGKYKHHPEFYYLLKGKTIKARQIISLDKPVTWLHLQK